MNRRHFLASSILPLIGCAQPKDIEGGLSNQVLVTTYEAEWGPVAK